MSATRLTDPGQCEVLKAVVHGSMLVLAAVCAGYSFIAFKKRRKPHLFRNLLLYSGLVVIETRHTTDHVAAWLEGVNKASNGRLCNRAGQHNSHVSSPANPTQAGHQQNDTPFWRSGHDGRHQRQTSPQP